MQQFVVIQSSGTKKMEVTVVAVRSSIACVAVVSVSPNLAKRPGSVEDGRRARVGAKKRTLRIFRVFFFFFLASKKKHERLLPRPARWLLDPLVTKKQKQNKKAFSTVFVRHIPDKNFFLFAL